MNVYLDSNIFIYAFEGLPDFEPALRSLFSLAKARKASFVTSAIAISEVLVKPLQLENQQLASRYERLFHSPDVLRVEPVTPSIALEAAKIRAAHSLRLADALHAATAKHVKAERFVTNDFHFSRVPELNVQMLKDLT